MPEDHRQLQVLLGAYLAGGCDAADRGRLEQHLPECPACRQELDELSGLPGRLRRSGALEPLSQPGPALATVSAGIMRRVVAERVRQRRRLRLWQSGTVAAGVALAVVVGIALAPSLQAQPSQPFHAVQASSTTGGSVSFQTRPWGTQLVLRLYGMPINYAFVAYVESASGHKVEVGSWTSTPSRQAVVDLASAVPLADMSEIVVTSSSGQPLLWADAPSAPAGRPS